MEQVQELHEHDHEPVEDDERVQEHLKIVATHERSLALGSLAVEHGGRHYLIALVFQELARNWDVRAARSFKACCTVQHVLRVDTALHVLLRWAAQAVSASTVDVDFILVDGAS